MKTRERATTRRLRHANPGKAPSVLPRHGIMVRVSRSFLFSVKYTSRPDARSNASMLRRRGALSSVRRIRATALVFSFLVELSFSKRDALFRVDNDRDQPA